MSKVTFVIGLSGSGKTHMVDGMTGVRKIQESFFARRDEFFAAIKAGEDCVISERAFLRKENQEEIVREILATAPDTEIEWFCFENNLEKANRNCQRERKDKQPGSEAAHMRMNEADSRFYNYPADATILPVWNGDDEKSGG
jgi:hypothetical protein